MNWNVVMGVVSTLALFTPIVIIITEKLYRHKQFLVLALYYGCMLSYNMLSEEFIPATDAFTKYFGVTINLLDVPMIIFFMTLFSPTQSMTKKMYWLIGLIAIFEVIVVSILGLTVKAITVTLGGGLICVLIVSGIFFYRQVRIAIMHRKSTGRALMITSVLFSYGCFSFIYLIYYIMKTPYVADSFLIYFIVTIVGSLLMTAGILIEKNRLHKLEELKITRKEILRFFGESSPRHQSKLN